ncbi:hypothetical protein KY290_002017 [Solanum tuberosum]|uniref:Uncharacterized protein n=1 Tax=Solanum tuberosum TaxID=4113 RepID=A0ABQ7WNW8_SOLTU|nr:hypothetical protein KY290_002017 [Solanum tuberosum]
MEMVIGFQTLGDDVSLFDASRMVEIVDLGAIEEDRDGCGGDVGHDEFDSIKPWWEMRGDRHVGLEEVNMVFDGGLV